MSTASPPDADAARACARRLRVWCEVHNTMLVRTPLGLYYVLLWNADGEAPIMQFVGRSIFAAHDHLVHRPGPTYAVGPGLDPEGFDP